MDIFAEFEAAAAALPALQGEAPVAFEPPRDPRHGDLSTNWAIAGAVASGESARSRASRLADVLRSLPGVAKAEVAGPGFVNLTLTPEAISRALAAAILHPVGQPYVDVGRGRAAIVEYVSANPTGPLHVGHARGAVVGDALASILAATNHAVTREYYINDAGSQVDTLAESAFHRYREALGQEVGEIPKGMYPGDYLKEVGATLVRTHGDNLLSDPSRRETLRRDVPALVMESIKADMERAGIRHDVFSSERELASGTGGNQVEACVARLANMGHVYRGTVEAPRDAPGEVDAGREQALFRSTTFGDDKDRPLLKADGTPTYFASDVAYHFDKATRASGGRGRPLLVDVMGADHSGYVARMKGAVAALTNGAVDLEFALCQVVRLVRNGRVVPMSKRDGEFVTVAEVVEEVGADALRFMTLMRRAEAQIDFDLERVKEQSKDNPVFYVQYAHARTSSALGLAGARGIVARPEALAAADFSLLSSPLERALSRKILAWPRTLRLAAVHREPHRVAYYLYDLAADFHAAWTRGDKIVGDDPETTAARLGLVSATRRVVASGLGLLGVSAPDAMSSEGREAA